MNFQISGLRRQVAGSNPASRATIKSRGYVNDVTPFLFEIRCEMCELLFWSPIGEIVEGDTAFIFREGQCLNGRWQNGVFPIAIERKKERKSSSVSLADKPDIQAERSANSPKRFQGWISATRFDSLKGFKADLQDLFCVFPSIHSENLPHLSRCVRQTYTARLDVVKQFLTQPLYLIIARSFHNFSDLTSSRPRFLKHPGHPCNPSR